MAPPPRNVVPMGNPAMGPSPLFRNPMGPGTNSPIPPAMPADLDMRIPPNPIPPPHVLPGGELLVSN